MRDKDGFTLIELLVVLSIIGVLSSVVLATLDSARGKARDARRISDMDQIHTALMLFYETYGWFPGTVSGAGTVASYGESASCSWDSSGVDQDSDGRPFIEPLEDAGLFSKTPVDPSGDNQCAGQSYAYYRYGAGYASCDASRGAFFVLGVRDMETSSRPHPQSPGWSCPGRNWQNEFDWVIGGFEN